MSEGLAPTMDRRDDAQREKLKRFLPKTETLIWTGSPQLSRLILRNAFRTGVMLLIASVGLYFFFAGIALADICGAHPSKVCRKFYVWPWLGLVVAAFYIPFLWFSFLLHVSGLLREFYGLTELQALKLRSNPYDRFQSAKLSGGPTNRVALRKWFGSIAFGPIVFLSLHDEDIARLIDLSAHWSGNDSHRKDVPVRPTS
ncbi:MAG: hypothetical protein ACK47C_00020 [Paracoccaceae bacterium]